MCIWRKSRLDKLWLLIVEPDNSYLVQVAQSNLKKWQMVASWSLISGLDRQYQLEQAFQRIPQHAQIAVALSSDFFQWCHFSLDARLSAKERQVYIKSQIANTLQWQPDNILFSAQSAAGKVASARPIPQTVLALDKSQIASILHCITQRNLRCLRLESISQTLSWLAYQQVAAKEQKVWAVLECLTNTSVLFIYSGAKSVCQKELSISTQMPNFASKLAQWVKQIWVILALQQELSLLVDPAIAQTLTYSFKGSGIKLLIFDSDFLLEQSKTQTNQFEFYALALAYKTQVLES